MHDRQSIAGRYALVRSRTEALSVPLSSEDAMVQSMADASPTKWHLAHTTWFFEEFVLAVYDRSHRWRDERWRMLFNSYYDSVGPRHPRSSRGVLSRPSLDEVRAWRTWVDARILSLLEHATDDALAVTLLGTHHEEQHQELLLTDAKHALWSNPLRAPYAHDEAPARGSHDAARPLAWFRLDEALSDIGHGGGSFAFDNETPAHRALVGPFVIASRLITNREYAAFVGDGGYQRPELWLADGWSAVEAGRWTAPLYWSPSGQGWSVFGMRGEHPMDDHAPVAHVSLYEADAYARWAGARLPTEQEWERVARAGQVEGNFVESRDFAPRPVNSDGVSQLFGDVWEWTSSAYLPYPRFRALKGALGEYNGKFMSGQMVLRGGSCLSSAGHLRPTYRNFFPPAARWQMSGIRLARDV